MRVKFTTNLDEEVIEKIKIQAVKEKTHVSRILERLILKYLKQLGD